MSRWTHAVCEKDYEKVTGYPAETAVRFKEPDEEVCCFCNKPTVSGIYIRYDPAKLSCTHE